MKQCSKTVIDYMNSIDLDEFRKIMASGKVVEGEMLKIFGVLSQEASF